MSDMKDYDPENTSGSGYNYPLNKSDKFWSKPYFLNKMKIWNVYMDYLYCYVFMLTACNDDFLDVDPVDRYSDAVVWTDESLITSFVNNIYEGQKWGFHTVMLSSFVWWINGGWAWESQPVVMSELSPSYQGILAPNFWIITFHNITWTNLYKKYSCL